MSSITMTTALTVTLTLLPAVTSQLWMSRGSSSSSKLLSVLFPLLLAQACYVWLTLVSRTVPEPYLDEIFHIPQAQKYCQGRFAEWDDKITTPPGLYLFTILVPKAAEYVGLVGSFACDAASLRAFNVVALSAMSYLALLCRHQIEVNHHNQQRSSSSPSSVFQPLSGYALHTPYNVALFPLLFFFSGLYYTDVASTASVMAAFLNHLRRVRHNRSSVGSDMATVLLGIVTLFMRQTNVFWAVVFMGGLEAVHAVKTLQPEVVPASADDKTLFTCVREYVASCARGHVHDPALSRAWPDDMVVCVVSLVIAAICNPLRVLRQVWPYVAVVASFAAFVLWNGGVVLGDKSNHVATIHLPQMLYIWPFFAFFSLPLLVPHAWHALAVMCQVSGLCPEAASRKQHNSANTTSKQTAPKCSSQLKAIRGAVYAAYLAGTVIISAAVVRYNTIIHPFTLADNRHYMFYVFRYTIRRASWVRYLLILPYTLSRWLVWGTLGGYSGLSADGGADVSDGGSSQRSSNFLNHPFCQNKQKTSRAAAGIAQSKISGTSKRISSDSLANDFTASTLPIPTSSALIFLLATALSLITAPLVEPRYFIIPWVMWRLMTPAWRPPPLQDEERHYPPFAKLVAVMRRYDVRLPLETLWFIVINAATGYVFLKKPYVWRAEDGTILDDGRLQRFMW